MTSLHGTQAEIVVRGLSAADLRRSVESECDRVFGGQSRWRLTRSEIVPCLVSLGGRVRLYEGRFSASLA